MVRVGSQVPAIPVPAYIPGEHEPQVLSLDSYRGQWVALFFYPRDFTFVCPTELRALAELHDEFAAAGAQIVAASTRLLLEPSRLVRQRAGPRRCPLPGARRHVARAR